MIEITTSNYEQIVQKSKIVLDFYADWCAPCKAIKPTLQDLSTEFKDVTFCTVNIEDNDDIVREYGIKSLPTLIFLKDNNVIDKKIGNITKNSIINSIQKL